MGWDDEENGEWARRKEEASKERREQRAERQRVFFLRWRYQSEEWEKRKEEMRKVSKGEGRAWRSERKVVCISYECIKVWIVSHLSFCIRKPATHTHTHQYRKDQMQHTHKSMHKLCVCACVRELYREKTRLEKQAKRCFPRMHLWKHLY